MTDVRAEVERLHDRHWKLRYPNGQRGMALAGVELILIDMDAANCASRWLEAGGEFTDPVLWMAPLYLDDLRKVVPLFTDPGSPYYRPYAALYWGGLLRMMRLITLELAAEVARTHHADPYRPL